MGGLGPMGFNPWPPLIFVAVVGALFFGGCGYLLATYAPNVSISVEVE